MKLVLKILYLTWWVCVFLVMNILDVKYFQAKAFGESENLVGMVSGITDEDIRATKNIKYITIAKDGEVKNYLSTANNPVEALLENGYTISSMNKVVSTSPINTLFDKTLIIVRTYTSTIEDVTLSVPYERIVTSNTLCENLSQEIIEQQGIMGIATKTIKKYYEDGVLMASEVIDETVVQSPVNEIVILEGPNDSPDEFPQIGYDCDYWWNYVDSYVVATDEEKQWLKFTMKWESGCNAESNKNSYYKGLFQWDPCLWYQQFPDDNIFDGRIQIVHTLDKLRDGADPARMWPAVYRKYVSVYGELSWLKD